MTTGWAPAGPVMMHKLIALKVASGREIPCHLYWAPTSYNHARPVVVLSHGAGSSAQLYGRLFEHWAQAGVVVLAPDHLAPQDRREAWSWRIDDLERVAASAGDVLAEVGLTYGPLFLAGHSYGAVCAAALCGAKMNPAFEHYSDVGNVRGLLSLSPPGLLPGMAAPDHWASVKVPVMLQYGDADVIAGFVDRVEDRYAGFEQGGSGNRWLLESEGVDHTFSGLICDREPGPFASEQAEALVQLGYASTAFIRSLSSEDPQLWQAEVQRAQGRIVPVGQLPSGPRLVLEATRHNGCVRVWPAKSPKAVLGVLPGFDCEARRYDWLGALASEGVTVVIGELPSISGLDGVQRFIEHLRLYDAPVCLAGHSAGGALALDALENDPARNSRLARTAGYQPPHDIVAVIAMGTSLQPQMLSLTLPHRQEDTLLSIPPETHALFLSGSHDAIAAPHLVQRTVDRYAAVRVSHYDLKGGTHYGFAAGRFPSDNPAADLSGAGVPRAQRQAALTAISRFIAECVQQ